ncbi:hypothetical protein LEP1GSC128_2465 [Leptospira borgpetersenii str. 200801926]|uniref:Uncharacterized protein n=1 Tax=Leptospira borgpetersenii str. 200801926 TaxID=1193009 RepID=A0ABP2S577_LEPBO|nr:hypothetical protein LEP1GSC128_2465 [Leptospira borgpetersenii str. 200801926]
MPTLGSTKQFANDELKPYVDAAKAGATDSGTFLNSVNNGEQVTGSRLGNGSQRGDRSNRGRSK